MNRTWVLTLAVIFVGNSSACWADEIPKISDRHVFLRKEPCVASHDKFLPGPDQLKRIPLLRD